jgi:hypothetical protein
MGRKSAKTTISKDNRERQPFWVKDNNGPRMQLDERAMAIFQPDVLIESQYLATQTRRVHLDAERVLMFAVLRDAVSCFQDNVGSDCKRKQAMYRDAEEWILDKDRTHLFSFDNVCEILGLDPDYMRAGLIRWKSAALRGRVVKSRSLAG